MYRILPLLLLIGCTEPAPRYTEALEPEEALAMFQLRDGFRIELFAAEPHVQDPVELVFDEWGRAIVVEMPDYPDKPAPGEGRGKIKILEDEDGDGRIDAHTVFAEGLSEATSVLPWKGGLIVTAAPNISYLKDVNGDGAVDEDNVLFTGFFENNSEAQITNLHFNIDNWIYAANFGQPGTVTSTVDPAAAPLDMRGSDFRFRLDTHAFEKAAGPTQFGQAVDDWGHRFATHNTNHISQLVIPWRYLHRHKAMNDVRSILNISDHELRMYQISPTPYWRDERTRRRQKQGRVEYARDHFTGSSGGTIYDGSSFGDAYYGNVFTGDVAGNLVHRDVLVTRERSPVFTARRATDEQDREFLATADNWFRPASLTVGPDGALYVIDMYRQHIETPLSIPEDLKADMDFYAGEDRGRIYRIVPGLDENPTPDVFPAALDTEALIGMLEHPAGWWRRTAHRLLVENLDTVSAENLRTLLWEATMPQSRLHALYLLDALGALQEADIQKALGDAQPEIRVHAVRLAEACSSCAADVFALSTDPNARVVMQVALSAGSIEARQATLVLSQIATDYAGEPWIRKAILSSEQGSSSSMLATLNEAQFFSVDIPARHGFFQELAAVIGRRNNPEEVSQLVSFIAALDGGPTENWIIAGLTGLNEGFEATEARPVFSKDIQDLLTKWKEGKSEEVRALLGRLGS